MNELIKSLEQEQLKAEVPAFGPGDTVRVHVKIVEGKRERVQVFEGVVMKRQGGGARETFTVRKISFNVGLIGDLVWNLLLTAWSTFLLRYNYK